jgi:hypothetical protein
VTSSGKSRRLECRGTIWVEILHRRLAATQAREWRNPSREKPANHDITRLGGAVVRGSYSDVVASAAAKSDNKAEFKKERELHAGFYG